MNKQLSHLDKQGKAKMVDISEKKITQRKASAQSEISLKPETLKLILDSQIPKGDVFAVSRIAGIMAAKKTASLIPLCHPIPLSSVEIKFSTDNIRNIIIIEATCLVSGKTGVEMEALVAASTAALTIYDMCKSVDREMTINKLFLTHKSGGNSGDYDVSMVSKVHPS
tara:strand:+ start:33290 stop:33793 length:504 start_codon:yes stop_codon:yes gene_type:complete